MEDCSVVKILNVDSLHRACSVEFAVAIAIKREDKLKLQEKVRLVFIIFFFKSPATKYKKQKKLSWQADDAPNSGVGWMPDAPAVEL